MRMAIELPNNPSSQPMFHPYEDSPQLGMGRLKYVLSPPLKKISLR